MASRRPDLGVKRGIRRTCSLAQKCIQGCNVVLVIVGMAAAGLAGSQFSDLKLNNYRLEEVFLLQLVETVFDRSILPIFLETSRVQEKLDSEEVPLRPKK